MAKYKEFKITYGGVQYVFVTRGRSRAFDAEEAIAYLQDVEKPKSEIGLRFPNRPIEPVEDATFDEPKETAVEATWQIPDDKMRHHMFRQDLREGMPFCVKKYGQPQEVIEAEAKRLALGGF